jgi:hypothetical protein
LAARQAVVVQLDNARADANSILGGSALAAERPYSS